ncbi:hypothetical protein PV10_00870 [Exophiala mesophila]|uniref:Uncharacterized protein n=1 Tax=Exophiala mesophila TaxID=212818 RepID=A0A0D1X5N6_EXOME|nr:uncharacterized protein PV10_00870 [Exophiala mesophila]KIV97075.1 hypothetical protein PV10_00870 [Exophiala mesophila]
MSQSGKRDADAAFDGHADTSDHALKKARRRKSRKSVDKAHPQPFVSETSSNRSGVATALREDPVASEASLEVSKSSGKGNRRQNTDSSKDQTSSNAADTLAEPAVNASSSPQQARTSVTDSASVDGHSKKKRQNHRGDKPSLETRTEPIQKTHRSRKSRKSSQHATLSSKHDLDDATQPHISTGDIVSHEPNPTQQKFVQATQADGLAAFATTPQKNQLTTVSHPKKTKQGRPRPVRAAVGGSWALSPAQGGIFIDQDPLISTDGNLLILPTASEVQIYSTKTSLLVRRLQSHAEITSCALSAVDPNKLYVGHRSGFISVWDCESGRQLGQYQAKIGIGQLAALSHSAHQETILVLHEHDNSKTRLLVAYTVDQNNHKIKMTGTLLTKSNPVSGFQCLAAGSLIIVSSQSKLLLGYSQDVGKENAGLEYTWREISLGSNITSFDGQVNPGKSRTMRKIPSLDVVLGMESGVMLQYEDLLFKLIGKEKNNSSDSIMSRKLHWHRTAVNTVKWSRDKNYLISGGAETVLVVWQLDTNQKQFLPHLSTSILNLSVSAKGSEYVLRLADNSVMVLSTGDLLPSANISGLALAQDDLRVQPMLLHPHDAHRLLAVVPANALAKGTTQEISATLLQIYDLEANTQISRQALTRNLTTTKNAAPDGELISEPNVNHISISHDGQWLATVDEWEPLASGVEPMYLDSDRADIRGRSTETCLRIWGWNKEDGTWELVTRVDQPHRPGHQCVLGLAANPSKLEFATIGSDATVRLWTPKARHRNGLAVKNKANEQLYTWSSSRSVEVSHESRDGNEIADFAGLAYSEDGSTLAASWSWATSTTRFVHLIDPATGRICMSQPELASTGDAKFVFAGRHLLCLSDVLTVFDTLTAQTLTTIVLDSEYYGQRNLTRNRSDGTVAVSISHAGDESRSSKLVIFRVDGQGVNPVFEKRFDGLIQGLLSSPARPGYTIIDERSRFTQLRSAARHDHQKLLPIGNPAADQVTKGLDSLLGKPMATAAQGGSKDLLLEANDGSSTALDTVLRFVSSAHVPSPAELFQRVVGAVTSRKSTEA